MAKFILRYFTGYPAKIQKVERPANQFFYVNLPSALQCMDIEKGEEFEGIIENKNLLILQRVEKLKSRKLKEAK